MISREMWSQLALWQPSKKRIPDHTNLSKRDMELENRWNKKRISRGEKCKIKSSRSRDRSKMNSIEWKDTNDFSVLFNSRPSITDWWCWMVPRNSLDPDLVLTVPDPLNVLGNTTFVQRGSRQYWEGEQALLQLQPCRVWEMLSLPVWREIPTSEERHLY